MPESILYTAVATSTGDGRNGHVISADGRVDLDLALPPEMGGSGQGANPEELFAAGYAACYHSALRAVGRRTGADVSGSTGTAYGGIGPEGDASTWWSRSRPTCRTSRPSRPGSSSTPPTRSARTP